MIRYFVCAGLTIGAVAVSAQAPTLETVATFDSSGSTENIAQGPQGGMYVTGMDDRVLWRISADGRAQKLPVSGVAAVVGVAPFGDGAVLTAATRPFRRPPAGGGAPQIDFADVGPQVLVMDESGRITATIPGPAGTFFNGITRGGDGWYLIADSNAGTIWRLDPAKKQVEPWLKDANLLPAPGGPIAVGANGVKIHNGWVYVSNTSRGTIYRVQMDGGRPKGALAVFTTGVRPDDFDIARDGTIYLSAGPTVYKISSTAVVETLLDKAPNGAAVLVSPDGKWLYWPTRGGAEPQPWCASRFAEAVRFHWLRIALSEVSAVNRARSPRPARERAPCRSTRLPVRRVRPSRRRSDARTPPTSSRL